MMFEPIAHAVGLFILGRSNHKAAIPASNPTSIGCNTLTPALAAIAPVMNGKAADPACPIVAENPTLRVSKLL